MKSQFIFITLCIFIATCLLAIPADCASAKLVPSDDEIPNQGNAKARLITCVGGCMTKYPEVKDFIRKYAFKMEAFEVLFIGDKPNLIVFESDGSRLEVENIASLSSDEIYEFLAARGMRMRA